MSNKENYLAWQNLAGYINTQCLAASSMEEKEYLVAMAKWALDMRDAYFLADSPQGKNWWELPPHNSPTVQHLMLKTGYAESVYLSAN